MIVAIFDALYSPAGLPARLMGFWMKDLLVEQGSRSGDAMEALEQMGFRFGDKGAHTSRTMMLAELTALLHECPASAGRAEYAAAVVERNCLAKHTAATRKLTLQRISELYALDSAVPIFRLLRFFWDADERVRAQLALLAALARDPLLRATAPVVMAMQSGEEIARQRLTDALRAAVEGRLNDEVLDKVVRNTASSWSQSGHLIGRSRKKRARVEPSPASTAFALVLGYLMGMRGQNLFETLFARVLDREVSELTFLAMDAKRLGFLDIKSGGGLTIISFDGLLNEQEKRLSYGAH